MSNRDFRFILMGLAISIGACGLNSGSSFRPSARLVHGVSQPDDSTGDVANSDSDTSRDPNSALPVSINLITYNIERGIREDSGIHIADLLKRQQPDIVCLQEAAWPVDPKNARVADQAKYLADALGYHWAVAARGQTGDEEYGMAVLVRGTILTHRPLKISHEKPYGLLCEVQIGDQILTVVSVHARSLSGAGVSDFLDTEPYREAQMRDLVQQLERSATPVVVAGDFNTLQYSASYRVMSDVFRDAATGLQAAQYTRLTHDLPFRIDYVFVTKDVSVESYDVLPVDYSDHRPVQVLLKWSPSRPDPET